MPYENIISIVLSAYLNVELAFIPYVKYSLATFASSCRSIASESRGLDQNLFSQLYCICTSAIPEEKVFYSTGKQFAQKFDSGLPDYPGLEVPPFPFC